MIKKTLTMFALISTLSSCSEKVHDVEYYLSHPEEMKEKIKACGNNPKGDQNCINAHEARFKAIFRGNKMPQIK